MLRSPIKVVIMSAVNICVGYQSGLVLHVSALWKKRIKSCSVLQLRRIYTAVNMAQSRDDSLGQILSVFRYRNLSYKPTFTAQALFLLRYCDGCYLAFHSRKQCRPC